MARPTEQEHRRRRHLFWKHLAEGKTLEVSVREANMNHRQLLKVLDDPGALAAASKLRSRA